MMMFNDDFELLIMTNRMPIALFLLYFVMHSEEFDVKSDWLNGWISFGTLALFVELLRILSYLP
jgi:hypothetical protein